MASDISTSGEWAAFNQFVVSNLGDDLSGLSLEQTVEEFRAYQQDAAAIRDKLRVAARQAEQGDLAPLDDAFFDEVDGELQRRGIAP